MSDNESLKRRVAGSLYAVELMQLVTSSDIEDANYMDGFLDRLNRDFGKGEGEPETTHADTIPIARLGASTIPFGMHAGKCFDDVPLDYLDWLCRSQEDFYRGLRAYLKHPELEARRGSETN